MKQLHDNSKPSSPCEGCVPPTRYLGCHSKCERFIAFRKESDRINAEYAKKKRALYDYVGYSRDLKQKMKRSYGKK